MADTFTPLSTERLVSWIGDELRARGTILGIPRDLVIEPSPDDPFKLRWHERNLDTPIGVAAGPHTQLTGNIVSAWLCGARVMELKTVQTLDHIEVPKPCIDMQDEGYNIEWSQELGLADSFGEYLKAWVLVHALHSHFNFPGSRPGVLFDVSVGYDLKGIRQGNMQRFLERCLDASEEINRVVSTVATVFPEVAEVEVPHRLAGGVTVSTMHGCPPEEIVQIATHLMERWGLHTTIKLNPTLLGSDELSFLVHERLGYDDISIPDQAFAHDPTFAEATHIIDELEATARRCGVIFAVKVCNTLEVINHREVFDIEQERMYLSGRPLHAIGVRLARRLSDAFQGRLRISFAAGADAFNTPNLLSAGLCPVTSCSDLLRPGGYLRLRQYIEEIRSALALVRAPDLDDLILRTAGFSGGTESSSQELLAAARANLSQYADSLFFDPQLARDRFDRSDTKNSRELGFFDCISAPCTDRCAVDQRVPEYMRRVRMGDVDRAADVIRQDNPLPAILGRACDHPCERPCLRTHLDEPLAIREIKRYVIDHGRRANPSDAPASHPVRIAVIGAGPCGLSAARFLRRFGFEATIFEARPSSGGMVSGTIPGFRAASEVVDRDLDEVTAHGVEIQFGQHVGTDLTLADLRQRGFQYIVAAAGAQIGARLEIPGEDAAGVWDGLVFLRAARSGQLMDLQGTVGVIGGGDVAVDCARTARRLGAERVEIIYRRRVADMPAQPEEIEALEGENIAVRELTVPMMIATDADRISSLNARNTMLGAPDVSGRQRPIVMWGSDHEIPLDTLVVAIGQQPDLGLFRDEEILVNSYGYVEVDPITLETSVPGLYAGGDLVGSGPSTIVKACGDGRRIAEAIAAREGVPVDHPTGPPGNLDLTDMLRRRSHRQFRTAVPTVPFDPENPFAELVETYTDAQALKEAGRCLDCDVVCSTCESVCPNRAIFTYQTDQLHVELPVLAWNDDRAEIVAGEPFTVDQVYQVAVVNELCNECGNCTTFCPASGRPFADKPRLFLEEKEFVRQSGNAFRLTRDGGSWRIEGVFDGCRHELVVDSTLHYQSPAVEIELDPSTLEVLEAFGRDGVSPSEPVGIRHCATLYVLFLALRDSVPWIPTSSD